MPNRSILIIGSGIGGLSAGCYAAMNGYQVRILEMHGRPGGVCTSWSRHGFTFDGCMHNLAGSSDTSAFYPMWRELGIVPAIEMFAYHELARLERPDGEPFTVYTNLDRLQAHMKTLFPKDHAPIDELIGAARSCCGFDIMSAGLLSPFERLKMVRFAPLLMKYGSMTLDDFAQRFQDPFLRRVFPTIVYDWPKQSMLVLLTFMARCHIGDLGWAMGGSSHFADTIARRFCDLGGEIRYHAKVQSILVEDGRAVGVELADGSQERADIVISNANGYATIFEMLGGRYTNRAIRTYYSKPEDRIEMGIHVSLGLARDLSAEPHAIVLPLDNPISVANESRDHLYVETFAFDPSFAPKGKSVLKVVFATSYELWRELARDHERYHTEKNRIADTVISALEKRFPGIKAQVEAFDVATPMTTERFTGNGHGYRASIVGMTLGLLTGQRLSETLPGLANFYMVGQWAGSPGVSPVAGMGRDVVRDICRRDSRKFLTRFSSATPAAGLRRAA